MEIRLFKKEDIYKCAALFFDVYSKPPWNEKWESEQQIKTYLNELMQNFLFEGYIVQDKETILAVCMGHKKTWIKGIEFVIDEFFVDTQQQKKKIGSYLMDYVKKEAKRKQFYCIELSTMRGFSAQSFYEKHGFQIQNDIIFMTNSSLGFMV